ncbi:MAG: hypothetical protein ACI9FR_002158, partial [Cryomorphaceae bacterium]
ETIYIVESAPVLKRALTKHNTKSINDYSHSISPGIINTLPPPVN